MKPPAPGSSLRRGRVAVYQAVRIPVARVSLRLRSGSSTVNQDTRYSQPPGPSRHCEEPFASAQDKQSDEAIPPARACLQEQRSARRDCFAQFMLPVLSTSKGAQRSTRNDCSRSSVPRGVAQHSSTPILQHSRRGPFGKLRTGEYESDDESGLLSDEPPGSRLTSGGRADTLATP